MESPSAGGSSERNLALLRLEGVGDGMAARRPFPDVTTLLAASDETWSNLTAADWMEAFRSHPRIGESHAAQSASVQSATWSAQEQQNVAAAGDAVKIALAEANQEYEQRFRPYLHRVRDG